MATTTNYGWTTPDDTALVKDGAAAIRTLGSSIDTTTKNLNPETTLGDISYRSSTANVNTRLPLGTAGQVLKVNSGATAPEWATDASGMTNPMTTTGDTIYSSSGSTPARLGIGSTGQVLTVAGGVPTWSTPAAGGAYTLLSTTTLSGTSTTISSISGSYKHLRAVVKNVSHGGGGSPTEVYLQMRYNSDTGSNYTDVKYSANEDNGLGSQTIGATTYLRLYQTALSNTLLTSQIVIDIFNYADTTVHKQQDVKSYLRTMTGGYGFAALHGGWLSTSAITSITFLLSAQSFDDGTVLLYGVN